MEQAPRRTLRAQNRAGAVQVLRSGPGRKQQREQDRKPERARAAVPSEVRRGFSGSSLLFSTCSR